MANTTKMKLKKTTKLRCLLGLHKNVITNAHSKGIGIVGQAKLCLLCGRITKWGKAYIPYHYEIWSRRIKK